MEKTVMIIDDSASMRMLVSFTLQDAGYTVIEATNGREAIKMADNPGISMFITDLNMPVMDGIDLIRELRSRAGNKFTPILILTTESQDSKRHEAINAGCSGWITKPFTPIELISAICRLAK